MKYLSQLSDVEQSLLSDVEYYAKYIIEQNKTNTAFNDPTVKQVGYVYANVCEYFGIEKGGDTTVCIAVMDLLGPQYKAKSIDMTPPPRRG